MDARTEKAYQERVAELESQNAHLESRLVDLTHQLAQRDTVIAELRVQVAQSDATIAALQQQVAALSKQVAELLAQVIQKVSGAMAQSHEDLLEMLPNQAVLNVDETGHKTNGRRHWTWCFRAASFICFKIDHSRGSQVLREVLGEAFAGTLGCDYFSAYHKYGKDFEAAMQFCLAHLIRDVKFLATLPEPAIVAYGERMLVELRHLFHIIHQRGTMAAEAFQSAMEQARDDLTAVSLDAPQYRPAQNMAKRFEQNGESYFRFITTPGLEPTNNLAEQAIRFVVLDRLVTQGTRSERGQKWCERIWTAIATCSQQQRSVFEFLYQSINNHFAGKPTPSLLPSGP